jgi:xylono-1,5-lactonase
MTSRLEVLVDGLTLAEAPCSDGNGGVYFSDIYDGGVHHWRQDGSLQVEIPRRRAVGGIALHADGGVVVSGRTVQHVRDGTVRTLLEDPTVRMYNDLTVDGLGRVLVGSVRDRTKQGVALDGPGMSADDRQRPYGELYRIGPDGIELLYEFDGLSNGLAFTHGFARLTHVNSLEGLIVHDIAGDGALVNRRTIPIPPHAADGIAADVKDHLWLAGRQGLTRLSPEAVVTERVEVPDGRPISVCFGSDDVRTLFITTTGQRPDDRQGAVLRATVAVAGDPRPRVLV